jgi:hypothetical protein
MCSDCDFDWKPGMLSCQGDCGRVEANHSLKESSMGRFLCFECHQVEMKKAERSYFTVKPEEVVAVSMNQVGSVSGKSWKARSLLST